MAIFYTQKLLKSKYSSLWVYWAHGQGQQVSSFLGSIFWAFRSLAYFYYLRIWLAFCCKFLSSWLFILLLLYFSFRLYEFLQMIVLFCLLLSRVSKGLSIVFFSVMVRQYLGAHSSIFQQYDSMILASLACDFGIIGSSGKRLIVFFSHKVLLLRLSSSQSQTLDIMLSKAYRFKDPPASLEEGFLIYLMRLECPFYSFYPQFYRVTELYRLLLSILLQFPEGPRRISFKCWFILLAGKQTSR